MIDQTTAESVLPLSPAAINQLSLRQRPRKTVRGKIWTNGHPHFDFTVQFSSNQRHVGEYGELLKKVLDPTLPDSEGYSLFPGVVTFFGSPTAPVDFGGALQNTA